MHDLHDNFGTIIKSARERNGLTVEALSNAVGISERHLYRIENENQKPSYDVLYKMIRKLAISSDIIFYPEKEHFDSEHADIIRMLYNCDERSMKIIRSTIKTTLDSQ